jgi:hypothetical protein
VGEQRDMATSADHLRINAELVIQHLGPQSRIDFGYNKGRIAQRIGSLGWPITSRSTKESTRLHYPNVVHSR